MKIFIIGASGFIGANLTRELVELGGEEVHILLRPSSNIWRLESIVEHVHVHHGDLNDKDSIQLILSRVRPQVIYHLGVYGAYHWQENINAMFQTAVFGTWNLLQAALDGKVGMVVNIGSSSEYGSKNHPRRENDLLEPNTFYGVAKACQTLLCQQFFNETKLPIITLRLFSVYGPYEEPGRLVPTVIQKAITNQDIPLSNPATVRDFIYIDDVIKLLLKIKHQPDFAGHIFNLGSGEQHTIADAVTAVINITGSRSRPLWGRAPARSFDTRHWQADTSKTREILNFHARYSLREGLVKTVDWFRNNPQFHNLYST